MEILHTIAEVSITLTGFAGIVFIFSSTGTISEVARWRVRNLLVGSVTSTAVALIPLGFDVLPIPVEKWGNAASWVLAFGFMLVAYSAASGYFHNKVGDISQLVRRAFYPIMSLVSIIVIAQVLNGFGVFGDWSIAVFIYGLLCMLIFNAIQFLISVLDRSQDGA